MDRAYYFALLNYLTQPFLFMCIFISALIYLSIYSKSTLRFIYLNNLFKTIDLLLLFLPSLIKNIRNHLNFDLLFMTMNLLHRFQFLRYLLTTIFLLFSEKELLFLRISLNYSSNLCYLKLVKSYYLRRIYICTQM
jgi:hypothetical protein